MMSRSVRALAIAFAPLLLGPSIALPGCGELAPPPEPMAEVDAGDARRPPAPVPDADAPDQRPPTPDAGVTAEVTPDAGRPDMVPRREAGAPDATAVACPPAGALDDSWLAGYLDTVVAKLTGHIEYEPGKKLTDRATLENRRAARQLLSKSLSEIGLTPAAHDYDTGSNVYAILPSTTGSPEHVVLGAHFDTVPGTPGASDNASGTAGVLAAARMTKQLACRSRNLLVVLFDEEEVGLVGSKRFARKLTDDGTDVHSVHTVDQIGWDEDKDLLVELERGDPDLRQLYQDAVKALNVNVPLLPTTTGSTDHVSFRPRFPAIGITEGYKTGDTSPHRHRATDTYKTIDFAYLRSTTAIVNRVMIDLLR